MSWFKKKSVRSMLGVASPAPTPAPVVAAPAPGTPPPAHPSAIPPVHAPPGGGGGAHHHPDPSLADAIKAAVYVGGFMFVIGVKHLDRGLSYQYNWGLVGLAAACWVFGLNKLKGHWKGVFAFGGFVLFMDTMSASNPRIGPHQASGLIKLIGEILVSMVKVPFEEMRGYWSYISVALAIGAIWRFREFLLGVDWRGLWCSIQALPETVLEWAKANWLNALLTAAAAVAVVWIIQNHLPK